MQTLSVCTTCLWVSCRVRSGRIGFATLPGQDMAASRDQCIELPHAGKGTPPEDCGCKADLNRSALQNGEDYAIQQVP